MSIPKFLDPVQIPFTFQDNQVKYFDVESGGVGIITDFRFLAVTTLGWTEPSSGLFKTPVLTGGTFMDVLLTKISSAILELRVRNHLGTSIMTTVRRIQIDTTNGSTVRYHVNTYGFYFETSGFEGMYGSMLDASPDLPADNAASYIVANATRNSASTVDGNFANSSQVFILDNGGAVTSQRLRNRTVNIIGSVGINHRFTCGGQRFAAADYFAVISAAFRWVGRPPHCLVADGTIGFGSVRRPNIDTNTKAPFMVWGIGVAGSAGGMRLAWRRSGS